MRTISAEARRKVQHEAPQFLAAIQHALQQPRTPEAEPSLRVSLEAFEEDFMLLYACVWYAYSAGVALTLLPKQQRKKTPRNRSGHPVGI